jgi:ATP-binding protein involved in chromosome partitioning
MEVPLLGQIPIVQSICESGDSGSPVALENSPAGEAFMSLADEVIEKVDRRNREQKPTVKVSMNNKN